MSPSDRRKDFLRAVTMHALKLSPPPEQEQLRRIANAAHALANELDALACPECPPGAVCVCP